jgi:hypothetical protein
MALFKTKEWFKKENRTIKILLLVNNKVADLCFLQEVKKAGITLRPATF